MGTFLERKCKSEVPTLNRASKAAVIVVAIIIPIYIAFTLMISSQSYLSVSEVRSGRYEGREVSVIGCVVNGTINIVGSEFAFNLTDGSEDLRVHYRGSMSLSDQDEVVVEGIYAEDTGIDAQQILTGCASTYIGPQASIFQDPVTLGGSIVIIVVFTALFLLELIRKKHV